MKFLRQLILGAGVLAFIALPVASRADVASNAVPDFQEVYDLISKHLAGESETQLNRDAVQGLLQQLHNKVTLVPRPGATGAPAASNAPVLTKSSLYDGPVAYLRVGHVGEGLASQITTSLQKLEASTNHLKGLVLDLRYADGHDYGQAAAVADLFASKEKPLLDWGKGMVQSKPKAEPITLPVAVLINGQTTAAAEALAAALRELDRGILIGTNTAGQAAMSQEFPLKDGQYLRIATSAIKLGSGEALSSKGVTPDISVSVKAEDELAYYNDPFKELPSSSGLIASLVGESAAGATNATNHGRSVRINEAELMRERKANPGVELDGSTPPSPGSEPTVEKPVVHDPVLGRALDLVKGISVVRQSH